MLHALDVWLHRESHASQRCDENGKPCVERVQIKQLPKALILRAKRAVPTGVNARRVLRATRERAFYNLHYELDIEVDADGREPTLYRIAICAQEWKRTHPESERYQVLWRAAKEATRGSHKHDSALRFALSKDFGWSGHFPCSLRLPPWLQETGT